MDFKIEWPTTWSWREDWEQPGKMTIVTVGEVVVAKIVVCSGGVGGLAVRAELHLRSASGLGWSNGLWVRRVSEQEALDDLRTLAVEAGVVKP